MYKRMGEWMDRGINCWTEGGMDGWTEGGMNGWVGGWTDGWAGRLRDGWKNGWTDRNGWRETGRDELVGEPVDGKVGRFTVDVEEAGHSVPNLSFGTKKQPLSPVTPYSGAAGSSGFSLEAQRGEESGLGPWGGECGLLGEVAGLGAVVQGGFLHPPGSSLFLHLGGCTTGRKQLGGGCQHLS